ncbi:potassium transporter Kup [Prosthecomicrobium pneumaticum]|uniref:Probable potassium transport system protein Kup n=1 Tax=Prosthecomicrobium pneumaticum TaxID=81895 RepID=A0A7W9FP86_9HYPH|nr:potassium transporter Kup [Prosthecomicrobium pneumaticum]MBB5754304.1 KUP system potassium uptake protein [Prosthecomicrobium pneumaticum]
MSVDGPAAPPPADLRPAPVAEQAAATEAADKGGHGHPGFWTLTLGSIGVVYGDIGTSPLYAFREALHAAGHNGAAIAREDVIGLVSLIVWALTVIVTLKYVLILLRADNNGEGGTLSLMALARRSVGGAMTVFFLGIAGAALFYGDAVITPAISVLSAVEGLKLVTPVFDPYILPITCAIIIALFLVQRHGTARVAQWFGPITAIWFAIMALGGFLHIADDPGVFAALNPIHAVFYLAKHGYTSLIVLGAVFLAVTGAEALYADLGHFGRKPIQSAWLGFVFPALAANYLGQGALVLAHPEAITNPFFLLYPSWALLPVVILATIATVIASQAVITGAYSITRQAIQLRLLPRMDILHTSAQQVGQIYMPQVNGMLLIAVLVLVVSFGSSSRLATAYGISVTGEMVITALLTFVVVWRHWRWPVWAAGLLMLPFLVVDLIFLGGNLPKIADGGYVPLAIAGGLMLIMYTWVKGTRILFEKSRKNDVPFASLAKSLEKSEIVRVPGTAVFLTSDPETAPSSLLHSLKHYRALHQKNVLLTIITAHTPRVEEADRVRIEPVNDSFTRIFMTFGYMETPNVPKALGVCRRLGWKYDIMSTSFFLSRRSIKTSETGNIFKRLQSALYVKLAINASDATDYFHIPTGRVVEVGTQMTM